MAYLTTGRRAIVLIALAPFLSRTSGLPGGVCGMLLLLSLLVLPCTASAAEQSLEGYKEISAFELKQMIDGGKAVVINVLSEMEYESQHISGSINIPVVQMRHTDKLPADRQTPLIFHCQSER